MSRKIIGKKILTADNATIPVVTQKFRIPTTKNHSLLQGVGLALIFYNAIYDDVRVELWSDQGGSPSKLIATSATVRTKAQIDAQFPYDYKFIKMGFEFSAPITLKKGTYYHLALRPSNYTGDDTNHIAWKHSYPDPFYFSYSGELEAIDAASIFLEAAIFASEF